MHFALLTWPNTGPSRDVFPHAAASPARRTAIAWLASLAGLLPMGARAGGGHRAVDDAAILEPGPCRPEARAEEARGHRLQHLGPAKRRR